MASAEAPTQYTLQLFDVLEQLPRDVLRDRLWVQLADDSLQAPIAPGPSHPGTHLGRAFRAACPRSLRLADQLTQRLYLTCDTAGPIFEEDEVVESHGAFLARQQGLQELTLTDDCECYGDNLVIKTLLLGGATCRHLRRLHIRTACAWTAAAAQAIHLTCPNLGELDVSTHILDAAVFSRLRHFRGLTKVALCCEQEDCGGAVPALAAMPSLRCLTLAGVLGAESVDTLALLTGLEALCARSLLVVANQVDGPRLGRALGSLTRLTKLGIPDVAEWGDGSGDDLLMMQGVAEHLGGLTRLVSLSFGRQQAHCPEMDAGFDVVRQLSSLTRLACPPAKDVVSRASGCAGGSLPLLQDLEILGQVMGGQLAAMLRQLRPLSQLRRFACTLSLEEEGDVFLVDCDGGRAAAGQAALLLAQAPGLEHVTLAITGNPNSDTLMTGPAIALMTPLGHRLVALLLTTVGVGVLDAFWCAMCQSPCLELLSLVGCSVPIAWLRSVVGEHLPALRRLRVSGGWKPAACAIKLAEVRVQPLSIVWLPELTTEEYQQFRAAACLGVTVCGIDQNMGACDYIV